MDGFIGDFLKQGLNRLLSSRKSTLVVLSSFLLVFLLFTYIYSCVSKTLTICLPNRLFFSLVENVWLNRVITSLFFLLILYIAFLVVYSFMIKLKNRRDYKLTQKNFERSWDVQGMCLFENDGSSEVLKIMSSEVGCMLKNYSWNHYEFSFEFKIPKLDEIPNHWQYYNTKDGKTKKFGEIEVLSRGFGIIVQGHSLDEYQMLKVDINGYHPHTRAIIWDNLGPCVTELKPDKAWIGKWIKAKIIVNERFIEVTINEKQKFNYYLSTAFRLAQTSQREEKDTPAKFFRTSNRNSTVGFRCSPTEVVHIRDMVVINRENFLSDVFKNFTIFVKEVLDALKGGVGI